MKSEAAVRGGWTFLARRVAAASALALCACASDEPTRAPTPAPVAGAGASLESQARALDRESQPGKAHAMLDALTGEWAVALASVEPAGNERALANGRARIGWILGGRFLHWDAALTIDGREHATTGFLGYDTRTRAYELVMISDLSLGMGLAQGTGDPRGTGIAFTMDQPDPENGGRMRMTSTLRILSDDHFVLDQLARDSRGLERVVRRTHYERRGRPSRREQELAPLDAPHAESE